MRKALAVVLSCSMAFAPTVAIAEGLQESTAESVVEIAEGADGTDVDGLQVDSGDAQAESDGVQAVSDGRVAGNAQAEGGNAQAKGNAAQAEIGAQAGNDAVQADSTAQAEGAESKVTVSDNASAKSDGVSAGETEEELPYIARHWNEAEHKVECTTAHAQKLNLQPITDAKTLEPGQYYLDKDVTVKGRVTLKGDTQVILKDGCTWDVRGIYVPEGSTLSIFAQSDGEGAGAIHSHPNKGGAAIGGYSGHKGGAVEIHGGNITCEGDDHCAGIGSNDGQGTTAPITIYGGRVSAKGGSDGAGIGGGRKCDGGDITIYGGDITAHGGGENGAGIGGGDDADGGRITVWGGNLICNEKPNEDGAGIGGGDAGTGGDITINGGTVNSWSRDGAGIGGGDDGDGGTITINGGAITCQDSGHAQGARIGGGSDGDGGTITINSGVIDVYMRDGAGIGGGEDGDGGTITINGGEVNTHPKGQGNGAGIGGGNHSGNGGTITITGGKVTAKATSGAGIGGGRADDGFHLDDNSGAAGTITISGGTVWAEATKGFGIGAGGSSFFKVDPPSNWIGSGGKVTISDDADVEAGGILGGIGGDGGRLSIEGGVVKTHGCCGAGAGIQYMSDEATVNISGGDVTAEGYEYSPGIKMEDCNVNITGGVVRASSKGRAAAIGSMGYNAPKGTLTISGLGTKVYADSKGFWCVIGGKSEGEGRGNDGGNGKNKMRVAIKDGALVEGKSSNSNCCFFYGKGIDIYDDACVKDGDDDQSAVLRPKDQRDEALHKDGTKYALVAPCEHEGATAKSAGDAGHVRSCGHCKHKFEVEPHQCKRGHCTVCNEAVHGEESWDELQIKEARLIPGDRVGILFVANVPERLEGEDSYVHFKVSGKSARECDVREYTDLDGKRGYFFELSTIEMAESVSATLCCGDETAEKTCSFKDCIDAYFKSYARQAEKPSAAEVNVVRSIANLGHYAQLWLAEENGWKLGSDYRAMDTYFPSCNRLAIEGSDTTIGIEEGTRDATFTTRTDGSAISKITCSLTFGSRIGMDFTITPKKGAGELTATVAYGGREYHAQKLADGRYCVRIDGFSPRDLGKTVTMVGECDGSFSASGSPLAYVGAALRAPKVTDAAKAALASTYALYLYAQAM